MAVETAKWQVLTLQYAWIRQGGWGSKFGTFLPLRTLTLDTADAERGQTQMQEMNICNNQDTIANKTLDKKYCLYTEEKLMKVAWSDSNRRFENRIFCKMGCNQT